MRTFNEDVYEDVNEDVQRGRYGLGAYRQRSFKGTATPSSGSTRRLPETPLDYIERYTFRHRCFFIPSFSSLGIAPAFQALAGLTLLRSVSWGQGPDTPGRRFIQEDFE